MLRLNGKLFVGDDTVDEDFREVTLKDVYNWMFEKHPVLLGHLEGCIITWWVLVIAAFIMRCCGKELGWVDRK